MPKQKPPHFRERIVSIDEPMLPVARRGKMTPRTTFRNGARHSEEVNAILAALEADDVGLTVH